MAWFYEIRDSTNTLLKRDGGFANRGSAKIAAIADANKIKSFAQRGKPDARRILVGQNVEKPTR